MGIPLIFMLIHIKQLEDKFSLGKDSLTAIFNIITVPTECTELATYLFQLSREQSFINTQNSIFC